MTGAPWLMRIALNCKLKTRTPLFGFKKQNPGITKKSHQRDLIMFYYKKQLLPCFLMRTLFIESTIGVDFDFLFETLDSSNMHTGNRSGNKTWIRSCQRSQQD